MAHQKSETKKIVLFFVIAVLIALGSNLYLLQQIKGLNTHMDILQQESESELVIVKNMLTNVQEDYKKKIESLTSALKTIEKKSDVKITELEKELKNVNIKSGDFSAVLDEVLKGVVSVVTDKGQGSGALITKDGFVITNFHVIDGAKAIRVVDYKNNVYAALVNGSDKKLDIAILKIAPKSGLKRLTFTNSDSLKVGEKVVAVGNPAGLGFTATEGIISQVGRFADRNSPGLLQIDVPINPGNSGGPIININGNMIGIAKSKIAGFESLGFAIPANTAKVSAQEITGTDF